MSDFFTMYFLDFLFRWAHVLFGITWIGILYYFNFIQGAYFKEAGPEALSDAKAGPAGTVGDPLSPVFCSLSA